MSNTIDKSKQYNQSIEAKNITSVEGSYTKIPNNLKVNREVYILNIHGDDSSKKFFLSLDGQDDLKAIEINAGFLTVNDFLYTNNEWWIKSKTGTGDANVVVIQSIDDGIPKR